MLTCSVANAVVQKMSYCPECCSDDVDGIMHGNKRYFYCGVCGAEWVESDNYNLPSAEHPQHKCTEKPMATKCQEQ